MDTTRPRTSGDVAISTQMLIEMMGDIGLGMDQLIGVPRRAHALFVPAAAGADHDDEAARAADRFASELVDLGATDMTGGHILELLTGMHATVAHHVYA